MELKAFFNLRKIAKCLAILDKHHTNFWGKAVVDVVLFTNTSGQKEMCRDVAPFM